MGKTAEHVDLMARLQSKGINRREFLKTIAIAAATVGLPAWTVEKIAYAAAVKTRPAVVWLHLQECTGCTETLLRTSAPSVAELILDLVSLDYHETLMAGAGTQAEDALRDTVGRYAGKYVCIVEGAVPTKAGGAYCKIGGRTALDLATDVGGKAGAVIALGSCASWGGLPSADPNPTGAQGLPQILKGKTVVTLPGCPANPYNLLGTVLQYATFGTLPALDASGRPKHSYGQTIHENCPRRAHFDAGRFVETFGDAGHRDGWCLYKTGCKGPRTHASCAYKHFDEVVGAWPIGIGHPCIGCTEASLAFRVPLHQTVEIERPTPPDTYPPVAAKQGSISAAGAGLAGLIGGALIGGGYMASRKLDGRSEREQEPKEEK